MSARGPPWLHSEPLNRLNFNADPDPAFNSNEDLNPILIQLPGIRRIYADPDLQPCFIKREDLNLRNLYPKLKDVKKRDQPVRCS